MALLTFYLTRRGDLSVACNFIGKPLAADSSTIDLARAEDYIDRHYDVAALEYFLKLLTQLPDYLSRVDENMQINGRQVNATTKLVFRRDQSLDKESGQRAGTLLVPLVRVRKGLLFDNFKTFDPSGRQLPTLPQWQVHGLIAVALRTLVEQAIAEDGGKNVVEGEDALEYHDRYVLLQIVKNCVGANSAEENRSNENLFEQINEFKMAVSRSHRDTGLTWDPREGSHRATNGQAKGCPMRGPAYEPSPQVKPVSR